MAERFADFLTNADELTPPVTADDRVAVVRGTDPTTTYYAPPAMLASGPYVYAAPVAAATLTAAAGQLAYVLNPAGVLATLTVVLPPAPFDGQTFEVTTTQTITALTASAAGGITVSGSPAAPTISQPARWRFVAAQNTWFRR